MKTSNNTFFRIGIEQSSNQATAAMIGRAFCLPDIDVPYMAFKNEYADCVLKTFHCRKLIYCEEKPGLPFKPYRCVFQTVDTDEIYVIFKEHEATITIYSNQSGIQGRYRHSLECLAEIFKTDFNGYIWSSWNCFMNVNCSYSTQRGVLVPRDYDGEIPLANYTEESRSQLRRLEEVIEQDRYSGRLILLAGPPGTGKSFYIKRLVSRLIQSDKIQSTYYFMGEGIHELELDHCLNPSLLIFEDADIALNSEYERKLGVNKILNFSSGFFETKGLFVFSSNLKHGDIDPAFTRDGRMLARIEFGLFSKSEAEEWLSNHGCSIMLDQDAYSLANLYAIANDHEKITTPVKKAGIGFGKEAV